MVSKVSSGSRSVTQAALAALKAGAKSVNSGNTVTLAKGDTLYGLAKQHLGDGSKWRDIANANNIKDPTKLEVGRELQIPNQVQADQQDQAQKQGMSECRTDPWHEVPVSSSLETVLPVPAAVRTVSPGTGRVSVERWSGQVKVVPSFFLGPLRGFAHVRAREVTRSLLPAVHRVPCSPCAGHAGLRRGGGRG